MTWVGETDLRAAKGDPAAGAGPIAQALDSRPFDHAVLLSNYADRKGEVQALLTFLQQRCDVEIEVRHQKLRTPTDYADIHEAVAKAVPEVVAKHGKKTALTFHLSPGTPAMAAIWILVAAKYGATLVQSSREKGLQDANIPFEIAAEFVPSLVRSEDARLEHLQDSLRPQDADFADILHRSDAMKRVVQRAKQAAPYTAPILVEGESGTGKELFAAAIHRASARKGRFVAVNCGAIPKELVESSFFGHKKGAFTGALLDHVGYFELAHHGTLFLDEVGELPLDAQVKLLRVLQEKKVQRIGDGNERAVDVRVIAATHRDLVQEVAAGRFREDLYYRLAMLVLKTPPLRDREGDIGLLAERFLARINEDEGSRLGKSPGMGKKKLSPGAKNLVMQHNWPGNVRELQATLLRAYVWSAKDTIDEREMREALVSPVRSSSNATQALGNGFSITDSLAVVARAHLKRAMDEAHGNKTKAAELLGLANYQTLSNWLNKYGVKP